MNNIICIASEFKGNDFLEEAQAAGWHVTLVTRDDLRDSAWAWTSLNDVHFVAKESQEEDYLRAIVNLAGKKRIDHVVGLDEFDVLPAARAREYLQIRKGMSRSHALRFRDKLTMRTVASSNGVDCPEFTGVFNSEDIESYLDRVPAPWIVKPRTEVSAFGIRKCSTKDQVWAVLNDLDNRHTWRDHPSKFLIERFIEGSVFHVDSVIKNGKIVSKGVNQYGTTPFNVAHGGGVFTSATIGYGAKDRKQLEKLNKMLLEALDHKNGVAHAEFLKSDEDGKFYLVEVAARVGGAYIANVHEHACGFNLWREWGKIETETKENPYVPQKAKKDFAAIALALAKDEKPDTSAYDDQEIVYRVDKPRHVGLIFCTKTKKRLDELVSTYTQRITDDFLAVAPVKERYDD
ncbi:MAG: ATP-grasp domain-containing protein [Acidobacteria bacterium]|nr:MAG: ATP-grasp domain-containing protein [Acidobacteriota bacterium]REK02677.1 MAG: ATP-grasp domain-containing protein [Acidobacteriota bacterium]REK13518.1 MAG: ATP-grasp domain-containing protein [Acidobacteriota bacterium]REK41512.1 MAG: ATP-grasp domain-containing protein [Acidobacteriota bacterium]